MRGEGSISACTWHGPVDPRGAIETLPDQSNSVEVPQVIEIDVVSADPPEQVEQLPPCVHAKAVPRRRRPPYHARARVKRRARARPWVDGHQFAAQDAFRAEAAEAVEQPSRGRDSVVGAARP